MKTLDFQWYQHPLLRDRVCAIPMVRETLFKINTWFKSQNYDGYVDIDEDGYIQYTENGNQLDTDNLWVEGSYLVVVDNKDIVFISKDTFELVYELVEENVEEDEMSESEDPKQLSMPFHPSMINKVIEIELRGIKDDLVIHRSAGVLKLYTYRDSCVHYRMEAYNDVAVVDLDLYYFSILRVV